MAGVFLAGWLFDVQSFAFFLLTMAVDVLMTLSFVAWWFTRRSFTWGQRFLIVLCAVGFGVLVGLLSRRAIPQPMFLVLSGLPILVAVWWLGFIATGHLAARGRVGALIGCFVLVWSPFLLLRMSGYLGNLRADLHWRWDPTAEQMFLAERAKNPAPAPATRAAARELRPGDWPGFRGPGRDGIVRGLKIATDWEKSPPKVLWKQRIGPGWSSMAVVDGFVFTLEQRGDREAVVCRDAGGGAEVWVHEDPVRFEEAMSGIGPRSTPTFDHGRIYAQGTLGALNCLDSATGGLIWTRDVKTDTDAVLPMWGFCASPLVADGRVIVFTSGEGKKGLVSYSATDGRLLWTADAGKMSYGSPQLLDGPGGKSVLMFANEGVFCVDPGDGKIRWQLPLEQKVGLPAALQVCQVGPSSLVLGNGAAFGAQRLEISGAQAPPARKWVTQRVKPAFSDMVCHDGFIYGFDGTVFCCVDAATGARRWREGRYGAGQVLLVEESGVMIVSTEDGQAVLLKCNPERSEELGRVQAVSGKAWNHQALVGGRLFFRSDAEMACLDLGAR
jgi:outer membrane protein assembly factor BamB